MDGIVTCKFCFSPLSGEDTEGTWEEGYCSKFCRGDHEKQLIKDGKMEGIHVNGINALILKDSKLRDANGSPVWFPKDGRPYFDSALRRVFHTKQEKVSYMKENHLVMDGSDAPKRWPIDAGDNRSLSHRRAMRLED